MLSESILHDRVSQFLAGELPLDDFEDWLSSESWNMHRRASVTAQRLASEIELRLAEHGAGHLSDDVLRNELRALLEQMPLVLSSTTA